MTYVRATVLPQLRLPSASVPSRTGGSRCYRRSCSSLFQCIYQDKDLNTSFTLPEEENQSLLFYSLYVLPAFKLDLICCINMLYHTQSVLSFSYDMQLRPKLQHIHCTAGMYLHSQWDSLLQQTKIYACLASLFPSLCLTPAASQYIPHICYTFVYESKMLAHRDLKKRIRDLSENWLCLKFVTDPFGH